MKNDTPFSLFQQGGHSRPKRPTSQKTTSPQPEEKKVPSITPTKAESVNREELQRRYKDAMEKCAEIRTLTDRVYAASGLSRDEVERYLENPSNFTPQTWKALEQYRQELERRLGKYSVSGAAAQRKGRRAAAATKERKGKTLGARKGWMPMR